MNGEFNENLEVSEETTKEYIPETVLEESVIAVEPGIQTEAVMTQAEDGSWRHAENSPFSPFYVPDRKQKKNNRLTIGLVILLLFFLVAGLVFAVSKLVEAAVGEVTVAWNESADSIEGFFDGVKESFTGRDAEEWVPKTEEPGMEDYPNILLPQEPEFPGSYEENYYEPSPEDDYYVELADALRDDLTYSVDFEEYNHSDYDKSVYISVWYAQVDGDLPNCDKINECLQDSAMYYAYIFESEAVSDLMLEVESFVTYMDEETLSVVIDEYYYFGGETMYNLYCMNFDINTGTLLTNTEIIEVSDELVEAFVVQSEYQNGFISSVSDYTNEEIADFMRNEDSLILFYTPVGLEIGYNCENGWVTATLKEYEGFLKKL